MVSQWTLAVEWCSLLVHLRIKVCYIVFQLIKVYWNRVDDEFSIIYKVPGQQTEKLDSY